MNKKKDIPNIRFDGFVYDWESDKLKKLASFSKGKGYTKSDLKDKGAPIILYGRLYTKYETVIESVDTFTNIKDMSVLSEGDEVIVPGSGETSEDIARASVISKSGIIIGGDLNVIKPTEKIESIFLALTISNGRQQKELSKRAQGNSVVHLYNSNLKEVSISFPKKQEQIKINSFFSKIDNIIKLQQQLLNSHKQLKKAMLQKMFPQKGETVPKVRFGEFTGNWNQKKLGEIYEKSLNKNKNLEYGKENIISVSKMKFKDNSSTSNDNYMKTYNILKENEIAFEGNKSKDYKYGRFVLNDIGDGIVSHVFIVMKPKIEIPTFFIKEYINNENVMQKILLFSTTSTLMMTSLNSSEFLKQKLRLPSFDEQVKIGEFFKHLDETIDINQKKLKTYQELKKAMLQKMFV